MNVVYSGGTYKVYGDALQTFDKLPVGVYEVAASEMTGFFLVSHSDLEVKEEKVYGTHEAKVEKILNSYEVFDRNLGVILSGHKGIGKSLFAKILAREGAARGLPTILVTNYIPGIASFLSSIEQEVIVLFDEFEKTFCESDGNKPQEDLLPLFDGLDSGKKLFVVTCNETKKLNTYLLNRPGRFHYHFVLTAPTPSEVREYLADKIDPQYHEVIEKIVTLSLYSELTYDVLRAIAFEVNRGFSLQETMDDLNIEREVEQRFKVCVVFNNGRVFEGTDTFDMFDGYKNWIWLSDRYEQYARSLKLTFTTRDVVVSEESGELVLDPQKVTLNHRRSDQSDWEDELDMLDVTDVQSITFTREDYKNIRKYLV